MNRAKAIEILSNTTSAFEIGDIEAAVDFAVADMRAFAKDNREEVPPPPPSPRARRRAVRRQKQTKPIGKVPQWAIDLIGEKKQ